MALCILTLPGCSSPTNIDVRAQKNDIVLSSDEPEYFLLRPEVEKAFGYAHAVKIGNHLKISGAVSMDDDGGRRL